MATEITEQFGLEVGASELSRIEAGKLPPLELLELLERWLEINLKHIKRLH